MLILDGPALEHDPEKACPGLDPGWIPVLGKDHAQTQAKAKWRFIVSSFRFRRRMIAKPMVRASGCDAARFACAIG
jgi:hypothetical protein